MTEYINTLHFGLSVFVRYIILEMVVIQAMECNLNAICATW